MPAVLDTHLSVGDAVLALQRSVVSSTTTVLAADSQQANAAALVAVQQEHLVTVVGSTQANTTSPASIGQGDVHQVIAIASQQANQAASAFVSQTHLPIASSAVQGNAASPGSVTKTHQISVASAQQPNAASAASAGHFAPIAVIQTIQLTSGVARSFTLTSSSTMPTVFSGDVGSEVVIDCLTNVSTSLVRKIISRRPDGAKVEWVADVHGTTTIRYIVLVGDMMPGRWKTQAYLEFPGGTWFGSITEFVVTRPL